MKLSVLSVCLLFSSFTFCQGPTVTSWLQNTEQTGSYYMNGNSTPVSNSLLVNCQQVEYSNNYVYVSTEGIPSYPAGPFLDGNPSQAESMGRLFRFTSFSSGSVFS